MENQKTNYDCSYEKVAGTEEEASVTNEKKNGSVEVVVETMSSSNSSSNRQFLYIATCAANISAFVCGTAFGWTSPEIPKLKSSEDNPLGSHLLSPSEEGWIGAFLPLGAAIGPFAAGVAADKIGRKKSMLVGIIPFIIAFGIAAFATDVNLFYLMRFITGLAVGCIFTVLPMYVGEISEDEVRGTLGSFMQLFIVVGLLFSFMLGPYISFKTFNLVCMVPGIAFFVLMFMFIPDSPCYLIQVGDKSGAEKALMEIRKKTRSEVQKELETIKAAVEEAQANKGSFTDIFKSKGLTKAMIICISLVAFQQFSGINIVLFFAQDIFTDAKVSLAPEICTIIIGIVQVVASGITPALVEKRGKKFLLIVSGVGMAVSQGALAFFFYLKDSGKDVSGISWLPVASLVGYIVTYCLGFGPLPWAILGELFPGNVKSIAATVTASGCWFLGFMITKYFGSIALTIGKASSFGIFGICCLAGAIFVKKFVFETSGKSLQEIQDILNGATSE